MTTPTPTIASQIAEIMDELETAGGPRNWTFDTRGRVTLTPEGVADLVHWAAKSSRAAEFVARIMAAAESA